MVAALISNRRCGVARELRGKRDGPCYDLRHMALDRITVVPAYPYEGALLWLFQEAFIGADWATGSGYYRALFGDGRRLHKARAGALCALFDEILVAGADAKFPDNKYRHPDLGLTMDMDRGEWAPEAAEIAEILRRDRSVFELATRHVDICADEFGLNFFLKRLVVQTLLADRHDAVLAGNGAFRAVYAAAAPIIVRELGLNQAGRLATWAVEPQQLSILAIDTAPESFGDFETLRQSAELRSYARGVRRAISGAQSASDIESALAERIRDSQRWAGIRRHIKGAFKLLGTFSVGAAFVPGFDLVSKAAGTAAEAVGATDVFAPVEWYDIGSRVTQILRDARIDRALRERGASNV